MAIEHFTPLPCGFCIGMFFCLPLPDRQSFHLVLATGIILNYYRHWFYTNRQIMISSYFFISVFITTIFLCASKMGLISLFVCVPLLLYQKWKDRFGIKRSLFILAVGIVLVFVAGRFVPGAFDRFLAIQNISIQHLDKTSSESNTIRLLIWEQSVHIIKDHFWLGLGVGDANDALYKAYQENGITGAMENHLNAHNQYLQTFLGIGFVGFFLLVVLTLGGIIKGLRKTNVMLSFFSLLISLNFLVESMLQAVAGTLFFAFFYCLFNLIEEKRMLSE
jgi:O-antigen ligase